MPFRLINPQSAESSEGFALSSKSRFTYEYAEGERRMLVSVDPHRDPISGEYFEVVSEDSFLAWQPPFDQEALSAEKRAGIRSNVSAALDFLRIRHTFELKQ